MIMQEIRASAKEDHYSSDHTKAQALVILVIGLAAEASVLLTQTPAGIRSSSDSYTLAPSVYLQFNQPENRNIV